MEIKELVLQAMKKAGEPLNAGKIAKIVLSNQNSINTVLETGWTGTFLYLSITLDSVLSQKPWIISGKYSVS